MLPPPPGSSKPHSAQTRAFRIEVQEIKVFPVSDVVYLSIAAGCQELKDLHLRLNRGPCHSSEVWCYQPHVTLAQSLEPAWSPRRGI